AGHGGRHPMRAAAASARERRGLWRRAMNTQRNRQSTEGAQMAYSVPPLPYAYDALEPHIDKLTMEIHHDKHHQAYVDKVNAALEGTALADAPIEDVLKNLGQVPDAKRGAEKNTGGAHYTHTLFGTIMTPDGGGEPSG